jgi:hypothetical protein
MENKDKIFKFVFISYLAVPLYFLFLYVKMHHALEREIIIYRI